MIGYQNFLNRVFTDNDIEFLSSNSINICFLGFLGRGKQNKQFSNYLFEGKSKIDIMRTNISYLIYSQEKYKSIEAVTQTSTIDHYDDLKKIIINTREYLKDANLSNFLKLDKSTKKYFFQNYDQYGGYITKREYIKKPKLILSRIKNFFNSLKKAQKFKNNFWG